MFKSLPECDLLVLLLLRWTVEQHPVNINQELLQLLVKAKGLMEGRQSRWSLWLNLNCQDWTLKSILTFDTMTDMARFSECAATYPSIMIPGRRTLPRRSPT